MEYNSLKAAIPASWERKLKENNNLNLGYHVFHD
jgi:hypothetical protein